MQRKVWVEISKDAIAHNIRIIRKLLKPTTKLFAVVKSNAYGHGLTAFSSIAEKQGIDGFCVDSVIEGLKLRKNGLKRPVLVLGPTLPFNSIEDAKKAKIAITISTPSALETLSKMKAPPEFHLKIDTGMHRQGFILNDIPYVIKKIKNQKSKIKNKLRGIYTHFAAAKDLNYPTFTDFQFHAFKKAIALFEAAGFSAKGGSALGRPGTGKASGGTNFLRHAAATGGTLVSSEYYLDAVRVGAGLYGHFPSPELEIQRAEIRFKPVLSWRALVSEVKTVSKGDYVGYDMTERVMKPTKMAIIPIGYWHGFDRGLSGIGEVLIRGKRARVMGRVSMDLIVVNVTDIAARPGDTATLIGKDGREEITAEEFGRKIGTSHYEVLTRINPLIERIVT